MTGTDLENFTETLFSSIQGFFVRYKRAKAKIAKTKPESDYDLIIQNTSEVFPELGNYILVECKSSDKEVGFPEVAKFLHKLHSRKCSTGIIVALGDVVYKQFNPTISRAFYQDGIVVIVFNKEKIEEVMNGQVNLASAIRREYEAARFDIK